MWFEFSSKDFVETLSTIYDYFLFTIYDFMDLRFLFTISDFIDEFQDFYQLKMLDLYLLLILLNFVILIK